MKRRALLKYTAYLTGYAVAAPLSSAILSGCKAEPTAPDFVPAFLTSEEYKLVSAMVETMLPPTATPGAKEVGVPPFIDLLLSDYTEKEDADKIRGGINSWARTVSQQTGQAYDELASEKQLELLNQLDAAARQKADQLEADKQVRIHQAMKQEDSPWAEEEDEDTPWWLLLKEMAIGGYYSSERIGTEVLAYDPIPGPYQGCIPLEEGARAWSL